jgi:hypothetical protein
MNDANATKKPATSTLIVEFLAAKGRKARKAGVATTEEIAAHIGQSVKYTYDRLWWLAKKEGKLLMIGSGKAATWRSVPKARKAAQSAPEVAEAAE